MVAANEKELFTLPPGFIGESLIPSPNATRLVYRVREPKGERIEVNGHVIDRFDKIGGITFSSDSGDIAFLGIRRFRGFVVWEDREYGPYDDVGKTSPIISPNGEHIAYTAVSRGKWFVYRDGERIGGPYSGFSPGGIVFSSNGRRMGYVIKKGDSWSAVIDGNEDKLYPSIIEKSWIFSPDSKRFAYISLHKKSFCRRGRRQASVVVDGDCLTKWHHDEQDNSGLTNEIYFSPATKRLVYCVIEKGRCAFFVIDEVPQKAYYAIVSGWKNNPAWLRAPGYGKSGHLSGQFVFSPNGSHFAYAAVTLSGDRHVFVLDGAEHGFHSLICNAPPIFSPNSERVAYSAEESGQQYVVLDDEPLYRYYGIVSSTMAFSPDSQRFAYVAMRSQKQYELVVGSNRWPLAGFPVLWTPLVWDEKGKRINMLVTDGQQVAVGRFEPTS